MSRTLRLVTAPILAVLLALPATTAAPAPATRAAPLPPGFLWGVAASGFQSEGSAPDSNWTRYIAAGRTRDPYLNSVDFIHKYREDISRARDLGVKVFRISIEWARVQPRPGQWHERDFAFYDSVLGAIRAAGMRPMITLDHWVYPGWAAARGGWRDQDMVANWLANARKVVDRYAKADPLWVTINEPNFYIANELAHGGLAPAEVSLMADRLVAAHNGSYDYIHQRQPGAMVTSNAAFVPGVNAIADAPVLDRIAARLDFIGIDYYYGQSVGSPPAIGALAAEPWTGALQADGMYYVLRYYARKFPGKPLYVVESGMPTDDGKPRADGYTRANHLRDTVYWIQRARADGINVIGYNYWSLTDNYEWGSYRPRFGLYTVDVRSDSSLTRRPTDAVAAYREITRARGVAAGYAPTRPPAFCSLVDALASCTEPVTVPR